MEAATFKSMRTLPRGLRQEGRCHGSGHLFLVERHRLLPVPLKMSGQHKLWRLDRRTAERGLQSLVDSERAPVVRWKPHLELALSSASTSAAATLPSSSSSEAG